MEPQKEDRIRILIVEDEGVTAMDTSDQLVALGYGVTASVFSGADALSSIDRQRPDLVLMDIRLKGRVDGIATAEQIRAKYDVPIVFATAYADDATVERAKRAEPFGYILKPFDQRELRTAIELALHKHRAARQRADFLAMLSHDIRNPLGVILAYTEMLGEELRDGDRVEAEDLLARLTSTAVSLHALVTNYVEACRMEGGVADAPREPVQMNDVVTRVCDQYGAEARRRGVDLVVSLPESLPAAVVEPVAAERIVTNLLYNALKFTPAEGRVTVQSEVSERDIVVSISDTGPGIPAEHLPHLFDRYQKAVAARVGGGTGLGLFIVKTLAEANGGNVGVESAAGRGTRFSVRLPASADTQDCPRTD